MARGSGVTGRLRVHPQGNSTFVKLFPVRVELCVELFPLRSEADGRLLGVGLLGEAGLQQARI